MKWKKFTLTTTTGAVDLISSMFDEIGIQGIEIEDKIPLTEKETKGMFIDILPGLGPDDGVAKISFYLDEEEDAADQEYGVKRQLQAEESRDGKHGDKCCPRKASDVHEGILDGEGVVQLLLVVE